MGKTVEMIGRRFGRLLVLEQAASDKLRNACWLCQCDCGQRKIINGSSLRQGRTRSCGCLMAESSRQRMTAMLTKHGYSDKKLYRVYAAMRQRCEKSNCKEYRNYGGRGIKVCEEWRSNRESFFEWAMANGYKEGLQLDRIDTNGDYTPRNCRFVTPRQNMNNVRRNIRFEFDGASHTVAEWARISGLSYMTVYERFKAGKSPAEILKKE